jgi:putative NADH-flavin reductase
MVIVIFCASGKVGRLAVAEALARGHVVRGFVHHNPSFDPHPNLHIIRGDIHDKKAVDAAVQDGDVVICTLGSWGTKTKDIVSAGTRHIIPAMERHGIERIVSLTGAGARDNADRPTLLRRLEHVSASIIARRILADGEEHIRLLRASQLEWTVLRSPIMTSNPRIFYKLSLQPPKPWQTIPRRAVAKALLDQLDGPAYARAAPFIHPC